MNKNSRILVLGATGMVGSAIVRNLRANGYWHVVATKGGCYRKDLRNASEVSDICRTAQPEYVFMCAAMVGGIHANDTMPVQFLKDNLLMNTHVIEGAFRHNVKKLLFLGSSCIYPKEAENPIKPSALLSGPLEPTNEWYALSKIAGIKLCQAYRKQYDANFISVMPCNLYGPGDSYDMMNSHVIPAMIAKFHYAKLEGKKTVTLWGSGTPRREFLHVSDLASACVLAMQEYNDAEPLNVGAGRDIMIATLATTVRDIVYPECGIRWNPERPDGTMQKLMDSSVIEHMGWEPKINLNIGIRGAYSDFVRRIKE